uniref:Uncharacterized protein n=1 Tax=Rhizophora mucronata TaxID=61149 RepID=A0A2P2NNQ8_RHIMU
MRHGRSSVNAGERLEPVSEGRGEE